MCIIILAFSQCYCSLQRSICVHWSFYPCLFWIYLLYSIHRIGFAKRFSIAFCSTSHLKCAQHRHLFEFFFLWMFSVLCFLLLLCWTKKRHNIILCVDLCIFNFSKHSVRLPAKSSQQCKVCSLLYTHTIHSKLQKNEQNEWTTTKLYKQYNKL